jgi:hypothetical protein
VLDFLNAEVAEGAYAELMEDPRYVRTDKMAQPTGIGLGILKSIDQRLTPNVQNCCDVLTSIAFRSGLTQLVGDPLLIVKPPTLFRMERGDRIVRHDDVLDSPLNRVSVVLHLSKNWRREFGGNTVLGKLHDASLQSETGDDGFNTWGSSCGWIGTNPNVNEAGQ